mmetsp:Transcript_85100/g.237442  ORF Transcript_85100/g.237442 Transcript_85100/m.237442 type:complete len:1244 (-) Transcript_85100:45-3776(-)
MTNSRFRDDFVERISQLKSAPEFAEFVSYAALKELLPGNMDAPPTPSATRRPSKREQSKFDRGKFERRVLAEARMIRQKIDIVEERVLESHQFINTLKQRACEGLISSSGSMETLLKMQKETDQLAMELEQYRSLNCRALFKLVKDYADSGDSKAYEEFLPHVCEELGLHDFTDSKSEDSHLLERRPSKMVQDLGALFDDLADDLDEEERAVMLESRAMMMNLLSEVMRTPVSTTPRRSMLSATDLETEPKPALWRRFALPVVNVLLTEYSLKHFCRDVVAAVVISVAGVPKAMSYAALADLPITSGIATLYSPSLIYGLFGSSRQVAISPQSVTCLLLGQMVARTLADTDFEDASSQRFELAMVLTFYTGLVIALFGVLNLSFLLNFISRSVLSGFVSASALVAVFSTVKNLLGLHVKKSPILYILLERILTGLSHIHWPTACIAAAGILYMVVMQRMQKVAVKRLQGVRYQVARGATFVMKVPTVLYLMALGMLLGMGLCNFEPFSRWVAEHSVKGKGASAPALYYQYVSDKFTCAQYSSRVDSEYVGTSSGDGLEAISPSGSSPMSYIASEVTPHDSLDLPTFPVLSSQICAVVHIPFLKDSPRTSLVLDVPTVAAIFAGEVRTWSDPRIKLLNPNLRWEDMGADSYPITVVVRAGQSGTTAAFAKGLLNCSGCNASLWRPGMTVDWGAPVQVAAKGNAGVVRAVAAIPWSIGYATHVHVESIADPNARCLSLQLGDSQTATPALAWQYPDHFMWPTALTSYILVPKLNGTSCKSRRWLKDFLEDVYDYKDIAQSMNFELLPRPLELDSIPCSADAGKRRLAGASVETNPFSFECVEPADTCGEGELQVVGYISASLPTPRMVETTVSINLWTKITFAVMLAGVTLLEHAANVKLYADRDGYAVNMATDLMAVGASNMVGALFGSFIVAGGFSRSALNEKAASQISLLLSVPISFAVVLAIAPLLSMLPDVILNIILFCAVAPLIDIKTVVALSKLGRHGLADLLALTIAFGATCFLGVVEGMMLAIVFSMVEFVWKSVVPQISELSRSPGSLYYVPDEEDEEFEPKKVVRRMLFTSDGSATKSRPEKATVVSVLRFEAPLWFANATHLYDRILAELKKPALRGIVLDMSTVPWMDFTAAGTMSKVLAAADRKHLRVVFANVNSDVRRLLEIVCKVKAVQFAKTIYAAEMAVRAGFSPATSLGDAGNVEEAAGVSKPQEQPICTETIVVPIKISVRARDP